MRAGQGHAPGFDAIVVGAGVAGLSCATLLALLNVPLRDCCAAAGGVVRMQSPVRCLLMEAGRCRGVRLRGGELLRAPHVVLARLLARVGLLRRKG